MSQPYLIALGCLRKKNVRPWVATALVSGLVTALSWGLPDRHGASGVGLAFLGATWWLVLRNDQLSPSHFGLALGGLFEAEPLRVGYLTRTIITGLAWALLMSLVLFPPFLVGYRLYHHAPGPLHWHWPPALGEAIAGQLLVIALPEEAFFRGYLQTSLDDLWPPRWRLLGAPLGVSWPLTSAVFAIGHVLTDPRPARLAVFFPALVFGWLRARTCNIVPGIFFHAACNLFSQILAVSVSRGF